MRKLTAILSVLAILLVGCQSKPPSLDIRLDSFTITPSEFSLKAGSTVMLYIHNAGLIEHDFNIMKLGVNVASITNHEDREGILWAVSLEPGEEKDVELNVPSEPGMYQVVCAMPGHLQAGMTGTLTVLP